jgi:hypothetical protein
MKSGFLLDAGQGGSRGALRDSRSTQVEDYLNNTSSWGGTSHRGTGTAVATGNTASSGGGGGGWSSSRACERASGWGSSSNSASGWGAAARTQNSSQTKTSRGTVVCNTVVVAPSSCDADGQTISTTNQQDSDANKYKNMKSVPITKDVPMVTLTNWYSKRYSDVQVTKDCFRIIHNQMTGNSDVQKLRFTAVFTCPLSGNKFHSGQWHGIDESEYSTTTTTSDSDSADEGSANTGVATVVWYYKKNDAKHAAAARALDCLNYMLEQEEGGMNYYGYCKEVPAVPPLPFPSPGDQNEHFTCNMDYNTGITMQNNKNPVAFVTDWLMTNYQIQLKRKTAFKSKHNNDAAHLLRWTSSFTCPASANVFSSGQLVVEDDSHQVETSNRKYLVDETTDPPTVWYNNKKEAETAAAARMVDCICSSHMDMDMNMESSRMSNNVSRLLLCVEHPTELTYPYPPFRPKLPPPNTQVAVPMDTEMSKQQYMEDRGCGPATWAAQN